MLAATVAADNSRADVIFISGACGPGYHAINGIFDPTGEKSLDGRVLYKHRSVSDIWIEHINGDWSILHESWKGTERSYAFFHGGCALEACKEKIMSVDTFTGFEENVFEEQPNVKMATGAEAEAQASGASSIGPHVFAYVSNLRPVFSGSLAAHSSLA